MILKLSDYSVTSMTFEDVALTLDEAEAVRRLAAQPTVADELFPSMVYHPLHKVEIDLLAADEAGAVARISFRHAGQLLRAMRSVWQEAARITEQRRAEADAAARMERQQTVLTHE